MARKDISDCLVCLAFYVQDHYWDRFISNRSLLAQIKPLRKNYAEDWLMYWTGEPFKVVFSAMERTFDRGYLEYGTSLRGAWLEPKGQDLLTEALGVEFQRDERQQWYYNHMKATDR